MSSNLASSLHPQWLNLLIDEVSKPYFKELESFIKSEKSANHRVFPDNSRIFAALNHTLFEDIRVVIIGQDPYHGEGQANGLSFSVSDNVKKPPSLVNIFKELKNDLGVEIPISGNLEAWSKQGVLLLNSTLTVRAGEPGSHQKKGWETFTNKIISLISEKRQNVVFLLWGNYAISKASLIDDSKHHVLTAAHPSPLARGAFFGSKHFSRTNSYLKQHGLNEINWELGKKNDERLTLFNLPE